MAFRFASLRDACGVSATVLPSPAKINLFLAVTGRRADGFHDLVSVVAPLAWGDMLRIEAVEAGGGGAGDFTLTCDDPAVPVDETNLVLKAARAFQEASNWKGGAQFHLEKRIPMGAGLGGGSSNGVAALRGLNAVAGEPLSRDALLALASRMGSDCALFFQDGPVIMRGRGERVEALPAGVAARVSGQRVLLFKPSFGVSTPWAYARLAAMAGKAVGNATVYLPAVEAEARLTAWLQNPRAPLGSLFFNNMEQAAFAKFVALPTLLAELQAGFGLAPRMSGSGSACFALLPADAPVAAITAAIRAAWGPDAFVVETTLA